ncbi:MAG: L,D-transpeptidase family protein [Anaerolineae bacterium]|nr:L,D-transpeptidase family protein [Anaerolineae bacterium]
MSVEGELQQGIKAARKGHKGTARAAFRAVLQQDPTNETALLWLAYLADDPRAGLAYIARLLETQPDNPRALAALHWTRRRLAARSAIPAPQQVSPPPPPARRASAYPLLASLLILGLLFLLLALVDWGPHLRAYASPLMAMISPTATAPSPTIPPSPSPTFTATPTAAPSPTATSTPTVTPTATPTSTPTPTPLPTPIPRTATPVPPPRPPSEIGEGRWIDIDLTQQTLTAYEGAAPVRTTLISSGTYRTPTPTGQFRIWVKLVSDDMEGPGYYLPDVPYTMYFYGAYGLHGTYWHDNFGVPMSHGCVNLPTPEAEWLFHWADVGTLVNIHD